MKRPLDQLPSPLFRGSRAAWKSCAVALVSFACGSLLTIRTIAPRTVHADGNHVFELRVYHTLPGKVPELESIFRDVSKQQEQYGLHTIGYWVPIDDPAWKDTFVYIVEHQSVDDAKKNWDALHKDPAFLPYRRAAAPLIEQANGFYKVDEVLMRPTDYSALK
jgi:NIPSNAP